MPLGLGTPTVPVALPGRDVSPPERAVVGRSPRGAVVCSLSYPFHGGRMYHHVKKLMYTVRVGRPSPALGACCWSSLAAPTANWRRPCSIPSRGSTAKIPKLKDLLMDIGTEELSHLEVIGTLARLHLKPTQEVAGRRRGRSAGRDRRRRRREPVQLAGRPLDGGLSEDHRRAGRRPAQQHRGRGTRQDRLRAADQLLRRRRHARKRFSSS